MLALCLNHNNGVSLWSKKCSRWFGLYDTVRCASWLFFSVGSFYLNNLRYEFLLPHLMFRHCVIVISKTNPFLDHTYCILYVQDADPFWEPGNVEQLIGTASVPTESISQGVTMNPCQVHIVGVPLADDCGRLAVEIVAVDSQTSGRRMSSTSATMRDLVWRNFTTIGMPSESKITEVNSTIELVNTGRHTQSLR